MTLGGARPVSLSTSLIADCSVCPWYRAPGSALACSMNRPLGARAPLVAAKTLTPNS